MEQSGRRRNRKPQPPTRSPNEDIVLSPYDVCTFPRTAADDAPSRSRPCETEPCKLSTCSLLNRSVRQRLIRTPTDFGEVVVLQMQSKPASLHSVETTGRNGFSKAISAPASTESR